MAYISDFKNDIFLSYPSVYNTSGAPDIEGWVDRFKNTLQQKLDEFLGKSNIIKIWQDNKDLHNNQDINNIIESAVKESVLFIAINSRGYHFEKSYCKKELNWFIQYNSPSQTKNDNLTIKIENCNSRFFNVRIQIFDCPFQFLL